MKILIPEYMRKRTDNAPLSFSTIFWLCFLYDCDPVSNSLKYKKTVWDRLPKKYSNFQLHNDLEIKMKMLNLIIPVVDPHLQGLLKSVTTKPKIGDVTIELMRYESYRYDANKRISSLVC